MKLAGSEVMVWNGHIRNKRLQKIFKTRNILMNFMRFKLQ